MIFLKELCSLSLYEVLISIFGMIWYDTKVYFKELTNIVSHFQLLLVPYANNTQSKLGFVDRVAHAYCRNQVGTIFVRSESAFIVLFHVSYFGKLSMLKTMCPDWAIFERSWLQILLQKQPRCLVTTEAILPVPSFN